MVNDHLPHRNNSHILSISHSINKYRCQCHRLVTSGLKEPDPGITNLEATVVQNPSALDMVTLSLVPLLLFVEVKLTRMRQAST